MPNKETELHDDPTIVAMNFPGSSAATGRITETIQNGFHLSENVAPRAYSAGLILRVRELLVKELDQQLGKLNISNARQQVLAIICRAPEGLLIGEVAALASVHPTTMTSTIERLKRDGLIKRRAVTADRRATRVVATQKGRELYERARHTLIDMEFGMANVPPETIEALNSALDEVAVALERRQRVA